TFELADKALDDLAKLARIPAPYFEQIDPELRAVNFNKRLPHFLGSEEVLAVTVSKDYAVHRVERPRFGQIPASLVIEAILDAVPAASISNDIRVIEYERDRR